MTLMLSTIDWHPVLWLAMFCIPLLGVVAMFSCLTRRRDDLREIRVGNPLLRRDGDVIPPAIQCLPLVHLCRTQADADLRALIAGARYLPLEQTAPLLRRFLKSNDPELQLHAQCVLQEGQAALHDRFQHLAQKAEADQSPALLASFLEASLLLLHSPLTPVSEHPAVEARVNEILIPMLAELEHPRALHAAARYILHHRQPKVARSLQARLPEGSLLHADLTRRISHVACIQEPPPLLNAGYQIT